MNKTNLWKKQETKLDFLSDLVEYALKNGFEETILYLGNNSRQLVSNPSLMVSLNIKTNECIVFAYRKVKTNYLSFVQQSIKNYASEIWEDFHLAQYKMRVLLNGDLIGSEGHGYPFGLVGDSIPLEARIIAVVDAFHAMHTDRPHRPNLSIGKCISEIIKGSGTKYDPQVVEAFLTLLIEKKTKWLNSKSK